MNIFKSSGLCLLVFTFFSAPVFSASFDAGTPFQIGQQADPVTVNVLLDRETIHPGETFRVAVVMQIEEAWHAYANPKGPGTGAPTRVNGKNVKGFVFSRARYLPGKKKVAEYDPEDWVYAYTGSVPVFMEVKTGKDVVPGKYNLEIDFFALLCKESCIPFNKNLNLPVQVLPEGEGGSAPVFIHKAIFSGFDKAVSPGASVKKTTSSNGSGKVAEHGTGTPGEENNLEIPESSRSGIDISKYKARSNKDDNINGLMAAILFGFIAGILLNIMPCVLPVLSIKITSLVAQAHEDRGRIFRLGLSFGAGIMTVFLLIATLAATVGMSWGGLFQNSTFNVVMISLVFVFALGMFNVYIISMPGSGGASVSREGYLGSFYKGILATFLATPCSGPFLGATLAWVLSQNWITIFVVFTSIGLGMATPYVILSASPALLKFIPKPGAWMETFEQLMGFILLGTVVYLFTFLHQEIVIYTLALCLVLGLGAYLWGRFAHLGIPFPRRWAWRVFILAFTLSAGVFVCTRPLEKVDSKLLATLEQYLDNQRTVVVDFTADWCPNCKYVEKMVLDSDEVKKAMAEKNAGFVIADITHSTDDSPEIMLRNQLGSKSIPFLAVFPGNDHFHPFVLRDLYSKADLLEILKKCP